MGIGVGGRFFFLFFVSFARRRKCKKSFFDEFVVPRSRFHQSHFGEGVGRGEKGKTKS